jgi:hypothetical protein
VQNCSTCEAYEFIDMLAGHSSRPKRSVLPMATPPDERSAFFLINLVGELVKTGLTVLLEGAGRAHRASRSKQCGVGDLCGRGGGWTERVHPIDAE